MILQITPKYKFKNIFSRFLLFCGLFLILISLLTDYGDGGIFLGGVFMIIWFFYAVFTSKQFITITYEEVIIEKQWLLKVFDIERRIIKLTDIQEVYYLRRQIMLGNIFSHNPYADWEDTRIFNPERIVFKFSDKRGKTIFKIGTKEEFYQAFIKIKELLP